MASPSETEVKTQTANAIDLLDETRKYAGVNAANWIGLEDTLIQSLETNFGSDILAAVGSARASLAGVFSSGVALITPFLREYGKIINAPETDAATILSRLYDYYVANTLRVTSRQFTFGSAVAGGSNVGTGTINRLNLDKNGFSIENQYADLKTAICITDADTGAEEHAEVFQIRGSDAGPDELIREGSGAIDTITAVNASDSETFITNPSFETFEGTQAVPTAITGWTVGSIANFELEGNEFYRGAPGVTVPLSLMIKADDYVSQSFGDAEFETDTPYYFQVAYNDQDGGASGGTITLTVGDQTASATLNNSGGWKILRMAIGTKNWYKTFGATNGVFKVEITGLTGTHVLIDDFIVAPYTSFDNSWYCIVGGATPFMVDDVFTFTDSEIGSVIQYWLWRLFGAYLPATTGGGVTWTDP